MVQDIGEQELIHIVTQDRESESLQDFAVLSYAGEGVARACLHAQDSLGMDVNLLLYASWLAYGQRELTLEAIGAAEETCRQHRHTQVLPLRDERRKLGRDPKRREAYEAAKVRELDAEFQQLAMLQALTQPQPQPAVGADNDHLARNLAVLCQHYGVSVAVLDEFSAALRNYWKAA